MQPTPAGPPSVPALVEQVQEEPPPADESDAIRAVMEPFLAARWSFDREETLKWVVVGDTDPLLEAVFQASPAIPRGEPGSTHAHMYERAVEIVSITNAHTTAEVVVELTEPTPLSIASVHLMMTIRFVKLIQRERDQEKVSAAMRDIMPVRSISQLRYDLRKVDGHWRVDMRWSEVAQFLEDKDRAGLQEFDGSEAAWLRRVFRRSDADLDDATKARVKAIRAAERAVSFGDFASAREQYDQLSADPATPDFVHERRDALDALAAAHAKKLAHAKVRIGPLREVDGQLVSRIENRGVALSNARLALTFVNGDKQRTDFASTNALEVREVDNVSFRARRGETAVEKAPWLADVSFEDREVAKKFQTHHDIRFTEALEDLRTANKSRQGTSRIAGRVQSSQAAFDDCPDWPESPIDVRIEVAQPGPASVIRVTNQVDDGFAECVQRVVGELQFPTAEDNKVLVRIYPPGHWAR